MRKTFTEKSYTGCHLNQIAFPLGGMGAGMFCIEGSGALSNFSTRNYPDVFNEPNMFSALTVIGKDKNISRVLEGQVPFRKIFGNKGTANGGHGTNYGLPRFSDAEFSARFPFAFIKLKDKSIPLNVSITGWSPFIPLDADNSSLPMAVLEFEFENRSGKTIDAVYSFNSRNVLVHKTGTNSVSRTKDGFMLHQSGTAEEPWRESHFSVSTDSPDVKVDPAWFRGGWFDCLTMIWEKISSGNTDEADEYSEGEPSPGASLFVPFTLRNGARKKISVVFSWFTPFSNIRVPAPKKDCCGKYVPGQDLDLKNDFHRPWYSGKFKDIRSVSAYLRKKHDWLRKESLKFSNAFFDTDLPYEIIEAVAANLSILKSPSVMRQTDGRLWVWEGCCDNCGCCPGSCTHVWNYAQALAHLFPEMERSIRETEFNECQGANGHQNFRAWLPIRKTDNEPELAAADGQLGGIVKAYRDWRISGNTSWLKKLWPSIKKSLDYCVETWDPAHNGVLLEPHHNTYDIEFWGPDGMCTSIYLGALKAAAIMCMALGEDPSLYSSLYEKGRKHLEEKLFNGEYFEQDIQWKGLKAPHPSQFNSIVKNNFSKEALALLYREGPKYQYGNGCLSDGILGDWLARVCGTGETADRIKVRKHLHSVMKYNFKKDLSSHVNPQRPTYAVGNEGGLLLCTWPHGKKLSLPFPYSNEVWTGIEYQVASHLMFMGDVKDGLEIVKTARSRYDGFKRNPFNEYECGHWYVRALASYGLLQGITGIRYDAIDKTMHFSPRIKGDFKSFICTSAGYGTAGIKNGKPFVKAVSGKIKISKNILEA